MIQLTLVTTAKVDEMSVTVNESPIQYYTHPEVELKILLGREWDDFHVFCGKKRTRERGPDRPSLALGPTTVTGNEKRRNLRKSNLEDDIPPTVKL